MKMNPFHSICRTASAQVSQTTLGVRLVHTVRCATAFLKIFPVRFCVFCSHFAIGCECSLVCILESHITIPQNRYKTPFHMQCHTHKYVCNITVTPYEQCHRHSHNPFFKLQSHSQKSHHVNECGFCEHQIQIQIFLSDSDLDTGNK